MISLYPHQELALESLHTGSILMGGVGTGKSLTALAYYYVKECGGEINKDDYIPMTKPKDLYIITTARKRDTHEWEHEMLPFLLSTDDERTYYNTIVRVDSWNNIKKYKDVHGAFFIFDEQRVVGSGAWVKAFLNITRKNNWILLSATPGDKWSDYIPVFVANGFYKNKTEFLNMHAVFSRYTSFPKIERYVGEKHLEKLRAMILVEMPFNRATTPHYEYLICDYDKNLYKTVWRDRWDPYSGDMIEEPSKLCYLLRRVANDNPDRIDKILKITKKHRRIIIFYSFTYELEALRKMAEDHGFTYAEWNGEKHEPIPDTDHWLYLVQYTAGAEGWNCIETNAIIFYSQQYSYKTMIQAEGRIDRLNTPYTDLYYYKLRSHAPIDLAIARALAMKRDFNERRFLQ